MDQKTRSSLRRWLLGALACVLVQPALWAQESYKLSQLPEPLKGVWHRSAPEMTATSRCAAAFDASEGSKMTLQCSIYIRMAAEGERRALQLCEAKRRELGLRSTCRLVQP
jgi:hypothetical protein